jgi:hypothetical protein
MNFCDRRISFKLIFFLLLFSLKIKAIHHLSYCGGDKKMKNMLLHLHTYNNCNALFKRNCIRPKVCIWDGFTRRAKAMKQFHHYPHRLELLRKLLGMCLALSLSLSHILNPSFFALRWLWCVCVCVLLL